MIKSKNRRFGVLQDRAENAVVVKFSGKFSDGFAVVICAGDRSAGEKTRMEGRAARPCAPGPIGHGNRGYICPINSSLFHAEANGVARNAISTPRAGDF